LIFQCQNLIDNLVNRNHISKEIHTLFEKNISQKNIAKFRLLPKLHKKKFGIRPIINCKNTVLEIFSKSLDFYMKSLASQHFSFLKDSQNLIQLTLNKKFPSDSKLFTADFESLYSNIPLEKAIIILSDTMKKVNSYFTYFGFHSLIKLVLENNFFFFRNGTEKVFFLQVKGIAMGTTCGPSVANLYLAHFENLYISLLNTSLYHRYIDDLFLIADYEVNNSHFDNIFPDLKLNIESSKVVNFLDLKISLNFYHELNFDLYIKPTNTFSYLLFSSNHPAFILKNIPKSLIFRIRRICSNTKDFFFHTTVLFKNLLGRNYDSKKILPLIRSFSKIDRKELIPYKQNLLSILAKQFFSISFSTRIFQIFPISSRTFGSKFFQKILLLKSLYLLLF